MMHHFDYGRSMLDKDNQLQYAIKLINGVEKNAAYPPKADG